MFLSERRHARSRLLHIVVTAAMLTSGPTLRLNAECKVKTLTSAHNPPRQGIPREHVEAALGRGTDVVLRLDVQGAATVRRLIPDCVSIFLVRPRHKVLRAAGHLRCDGVLLPILSLSLW